MSDSSLITLLVVSVLAAIIAGVTENKYIIKENKIKRKFWGALKIGIPWALVSYLAYDYWLYSLLVFIGVVVTRYALFDTGLNQVMKWDWDYMGTTSTFDLWGKKLKIPFWLRYIVLGLFILTTVLLAIYV